MTSMSASKKGRRMLRTWMGVLAALVFAVAMCGCGGKKNNATDAAQTANDQSEKTNGTWSDGSAWTVSKDEYFQWNADGDEIIGLTPDGWTQTTIVVPMKCKLISGEVFSTNEKIERVAFENPDIEFDDSFTGFIRCINLAEIAFPRKMAAIPSYCCAGCERLTTIQWPESLQEIKSDAFSGCASLRTVHIPTPVSVIGPCAFENCEYLSDLTLDDYLIEIGPGAFRSCCSLAHVNLPKSISTVGEEAFEGTIFEEIMTDEDAKIIFPDAWGKDDDNSDTKENAGGTEEDDEIEQIPVADQSDEGDTRDDGEISDDITTGSIPSI